VKNCDKKIEYNSQILVSKKVVESASKQKTGTEAKALGAGRQATAWALPSYLHARHHRDRNLACHNEETQTGAA
jgi:hypothetical protein